MTPRTWLPFAGLILAVACAGAQTPPPAQTPMPVQTAAPVPTRGASPTPLPAQTPMADTQPKWLTDLVAEMSRAPVANPPARIIRFDYKNALVYYVPPRMGDVPSRLFDDQGKVICSPDGGMTGRGDGKCADFFDVRKNEKLIWQDTRR